MNSILNVFLNKLIDNMKKITIPTQITTFAH